MAQTVVAVFNSHTGAIHGIEELRRAGFQPSQISILAPDPREAEGYAEELGVRVIQASGLGIAAGGVLGGLAGWLAGLTGLLVPGAGIILAAGPFAGALVGAVGGASLGGFVGALVGLGLPHHAAEEFDRALREGQTILVVHPAGNLIGAEVALHRAQPLGLHHYEEAIGAEIDADLSPGLPRPVHAPFANPTEHVEPAAPDLSRSPAGNAAAIEGQRIMLHDQHLDQADLRPIGGRADT